MVSENVKEAGGSNPFSPLQVFYRKLPRRRRQARVSAVSLPIGLELTPAEGKYETPPLQAFVV